MKKNILIGLIALCFWGGVIVSCFANPPSYNITVQGRLTDSSGNPIKQKVLNPHDNSLQISDGTSPISVNPIQGRGYQIKTDDYGVFNVTLSVPQDGFNLLQNQCSLIINTTDNSANALTFTQPFTAAPYAIRAKRAIDADNAGTAGTATSAPNYVLKAGDGMIGTLSVNAGNKDYGIKSQGRWYGGSFESTVPNYGVGIYGNGSGTGISGFSKDGTGVYGVCSDTGAGTGVKGSSSYGIGVYGQSSSGTGGSFESTNGTAVYGKTLGTSSTAYSGYFTGGKGVYVEGTLEVLGANVGVYGWTQNPASGSAGVKGKGIVGVYGISTDPKGVALYGEGNSAIGVYGETSASDNYAGWFKNTKGKDSPGIQVDGYIKSSGTVRAPNVDFAEWIKVSDQTISAGDVLVIDPARIESLKKSKEPFSTLVAGIVSTKPAFVGGYYIKEKNQTIDLSNEEMEKNGYKMLSLAGRVPCNVSAENGPIEIGDLLTTSSTPGYAMKVTDKIKAMGAIVGKALEPLKEGKGKITVLVTLQ